ncbi:alpha-glucan phosphorylase [Solidesulfovibrio fructosivorans JJ]]|uniref:Alpha-glucan phosphorylase n=1 Tax=Solidesulfovibrio fructosivorans JJ] TaxID=596151 RepID=E1JT32_SOLFR|nr:alpha-glucan family phosphorylase [Solidesulfovibrio fructosivorans]EFL52665.1 alpha-glucan phosphorylase [Solidesulfovibrio fructosivorans JJ]]
MQPLRVYSVVPKLPPKLNALWDLAYNLLFSWNDDITTLFAQVDRKLWRECSGNPVGFLNKLPQKTLENLAEDDFFVERVRDLRQTLETYLSRKTTSIPFPDRDGQPVVAYFSLEYGISACLPVYSGGLGILAGDHLKSASDLCVPLVGIGLCYQQGYFRQYLTADGWQQERYPIYDFQQMPLSLCKNEAGAPIMIHVDLKGERVHAQIWKAQVGRVPLYLMDTNVPENQPASRQLTNRLYGGDLETRVRQEYLLGIGGIRALEALSLKPKVIHMNEGHSAFAGLERIAIFMDKHKLSFEAAMELVASSSIFTTHTPVPAGNDRFPPDLIQAYFEDYAKRLGLAFKVLMALGREDPRNDAEHFCMPVLALKLSRFNNGVSKLHGVVSRKMWNRVWNQYPVEDVPIGALTNGVHVPTWVAQDMAALYDRYFGVNWREDPDTNRVFAQTYLISDAELWRTHERLRERLVGYVRERLRDQLLARGARRAELQSAEEVLDPQTLTIGFARRFATYKRANLLLSDKARLLKILSNTDHPVQFIFAGKAHPHDNEGKKIIQELVQLCQSSQCRFNMVFLEDYDMEIASYLVQGVDVWLNTPRRPLEACGTSGMKAMCNGVLNYSTLDGWWAEAWKPDNSVGWAIGQGEEYEDGGYQDFVESQTLYNILENEIIPTFYDRGHHGNLPRNWIHKMKDSISQLAPHYNSHRMVEDYARVAYVPALENYNRLTRDDCAAAKNLASWRMDMMTKWSSLDIRNIRSEDPEELHVGDPVLVRAEVHLNGIRPQDLEVQIYAGRLDYEGKFAQRETVNMQTTETTPDGWHVYTGKIQPTEAGRFGYTVRILPHHPLLLDSHSLGLIRWASA